MEKSAIQLREATLDDVIGIVYVQATTSLDCYPNTGHDITEDDVRSQDFHSLVPQWQHTLQSPNYKVWVHARGEEIISFIAARKDEDSHEIAFQYVLPAEQRKGLGKELLETATAWLGTAEPISLRIASYLGKAADFYKQNGFWVNPMAELDWWRLPSGKIIPMVEMRTGEPDEAEPISSAISPEPIAEKVIEPPVDMKVKTPDIPKPNVVTKMLIGRAELARLSGVRASTIKHYTEIGLLPFEQEEVRLARRYNRDVATKRLQEIQELRSQGLSLPQIQNKLEDKS